MLRLPVALATAIGELADNESYGRLATCCKGMQSALAADLDLRRPYFFIPQRWVESKEYCQMVMARGGPACSVDDFRAIERRVQPGTHLPNFVVALR